MQEIVIFDFKNQQWSDWVSTQRIGYLSWSRDGEYLCFQNFEAGVWNHSRRFAFVGSRHEHGRDLRDRTGTAAIPDIPILENCVAL
jgi:hypothetical protein